MLVADRSRRALLTVIPQAAESVIADGMDAGLWVLLLNVHLVPQWLPRLHGIVAAISSESTHKDFRLIVTTTASCTAFPFSFVQNCTAARRSCFCIAWCAQLLTNPFATGVKFVSVAPVGLRAGMLARHATP